MRYLAMVLWLAAIGLGLPAGFSKASLSTIGSGHSTSTASAADFEFETRRAEAAITACRDEDLPCIASALERYASAIRVLLPKPLLCLPSAVSLAARGVRRAKTRAQAVAAVKTAAAGIHGTICLLKADDPIVLNAETREASFVAETLDVATTKLEEAVGL